MEFLSGYTVLAIVGICLCVGYIIKNLIPSDKVNKFIPLAMGILGVAVNIWINLAISPDIILGGLVSGLSSTGLYEAFHQFIIKQ